ncbi:MAG: 1-acyl-sn-glycerol-3-phosphate acyltransferase [Burkholderiales bacterium]|nr:1-acyl-sn-glycerol-3-phosphate acyltransferase [Burkholderiales bacterium]
MKDLDALVRSCLFALLQALITPPFAVVAILTFPFAPLLRYRVISNWARFFVWLARVLCGIRYRVVGRSHVPASPCVYLCKHQSAWETLVFQVILPPHVMVVKRELLWIPFFGWGLAMISPIAIDRAAGRRALKQILEQGKERLAGGFSVVIYPEGTRTAPGRRGNYQPGGAWLALRAGVPAVPIAHNAGYLWPRNSFVKRPGVITVSIGAPIATEGMRPDALMEQAADWIEAEAARLGDGRARK